MDQEKLLFPKELNFMKFIYIVFILFIPFSHASDLTSLFNESIKTANLDFIQSSINPYTNSIDKSEGRIIRDQESLIFYIDNPFKEKYELSKKEIIITDLELDQVSNIQLTEIPTNILVDIFINGLSSNNPNYDLEHSKNTILIKSLIDEGYNQIEVKFKKNRIYYLKYRDNLDIENLIMFKKLAAN